MHILHKCCISAGLFSDQSIRRNTMRLLREFIKFILLTDLSVWLSACGVGSTTSTPWSTAELIETDVGNAFDPQIMSLSAYL
jgi:hypothetical protein